LWELGIETARDLAEADPAYVAGMVEGVTVEMVEGWQVSAGIDARASGREEAVSREATDRERAVGGAAPGSAKPADDDKPEPSPVEPSRSPMDALAELYEEGSWKGLPQWKCRLCLWDTLEGEAAVRAHVTRRHVIGPPEGAAKGVDHKPTILVAKH
jgi:hypothetical protein